MFRRTAPAGLSAALLLALAPAGLPAQAAPGEIDLQILSFNDFHGNIEAPDDPTEPGGAANLAAHLDRLRAGAAHSATVVGGDSIGASPFLSSAFRDEPTIDALSAMDLTAVAVGNHEFDQGTDELLRMDRGGCLDDGDGSGGRNSCPIPGKTFTGAAFPFLAANVLWKDSGEPMLPSYVIEEYDGVKVAYVGLGLDETPDIVSAAGIQDVDFVDAATRANELVPELKAQGVEAMVAVIHEGGTSENGTDVSGDVMEFHEQLDPEYDVIASGHTHTDYITTVDGRLITQAGNYGELITKIDLRLDPQTKDVVPGSAVAEQVPVTQEVTPDETVAAIVAEYKALIGTVADEVLGTVSAQVTHDRYAVAVSPLGRLIADAQLADQSVVTAGEEPVLALMNPGGIRVPELDQAGADGTTDGKITMEEAFSAQPFNNYLVSMDLTGAQIHQVLREQFSGENAEVVKVLQTSTGFTYTIDDTDTPELVPGSVQLNGQAVADDGSTTYRVVTNNFLAGGGDNFPTLAQGDNVYFGGLDIDAFRNYLEAASPYTPVDPDVPAVGGPIIDTGVTAPAEGAGQVALTGGVLAMLAGAGLLGARRRRA